MQTPLRQELPGVLVTSCLSDLREGWFRLNGATPHHLTHYI